MKRLLIKKSFELQYKWRVVVPSASTDTSFYLILGFCHNATYIFLPGARSVLYKTPHLKTDLGYLGRLQLVRTGRPGQAICKENSTINKNCQFSFSFSFSFIYVIRHDTIHNNTLPTHSKQISLFLRSMHSRNGFFLAKTL